MSRFDKLSFNLREPEDALVWLDAFAAKCRAEKKTDVAATASNAADFQITDQFLFRCGMESLKKLKSLVAPKGTENHAVQRYRNQRYSKDSSSLNKD